MESEKLNEAAISASSAVAKGALKRPLDFYWMPSALSFKGQDPFYVILVISRQHRHPLIQGVLFLVML